MGEGQMKTIATAEQVKKDIKSRNKRPCLVNRENQKDSHEVNVLGNCQCGRFKEKK
jgi:hypothetical protein